MKYTETAAGGVVALHARELCRPKNAPPLSAKEALRLSFLSRLRQNAVYEALTEYGGIRFLIRCEAEGLTDAGEDCFRTVTEFFVARAGKTQNACPKPSDYAVICAACASATDGQKTVIRRVLLTPDGQGTLSVCDTAYTAEELKERLNGFLLAVRHRAEFETGRAAEQKESLAGLKFPHASLREGQRELIETVYTAVRQKERLFAQAPTGIGKTVSVLYGTARAMAAGGFRRVFYLTAKNAARREAFAAAALLNKEGAGLRTVVLAAKEQMCPPAEAAGGCFSCTGDDCPYRKGYGPKAAGALLALLEKHRGYPVSTVRRAALEAGVCPYEFSLDLSEYCDVIICDYNSVFDPGVRLQRYFETGDPRDCVLLVDEAHNLPARASDTFSAVLGETDLDAFSPFADASAQLRDLLEALRGALGSLRGLCAENTEKDENGLENGWYYGTELPEKPTAAAAALEETLVLFRVTHRDDAEAFAAASSLLRLLGKWKNAAAAYDSHYRTYVTLERGVLRVKLYCLDPSERLNATLSSVRAAVFFSATLSPSDYFADILGAGKNAVSLTLPSPFPRENLFLGAVTSVDTRYESREKSAKKICAVIAAAVSARRGNYMVFFPSYAYLRTVTSLFREKYPNVKVKIQKPGMSRREREDFLAFFEEESGGLRIGFCVLGGSFSEGIDLPGGQLIGTVVVGVGLPGLSAESNMVRDYYDVRSECGFDYAYTYPGMNRVLQAAGRVIRRESDRGAVILVDDRYAAEKYRALMPPHWDRLRFFGDLRELQAALGSFWRECT